MLRIEQAQPLKAGGGQAADLGRGEHELRGHDRGQVEGREEQRVRPEQDRIEVPCGIQPR
jgi:hypothetical protein